MKKETKRKADEIVLECKSDPKKIIAHVKHNIETLSPELKKELWIRASTLAGRFLTLKE